jgi:hypothetical protein
MRLDCSLRSLTPGICAQLRLLRRTRLLLAHLAVVLLALVAAQGLAAAPAWAQNALSDAPESAPAENQHEGIGWAVTLEPAALHGRPDESSEQFTVVRPLTPLRIHGYEGEWAYVFNPRGRGTAYVRSKLLGPSDPPSHYYFADPPAVEEEMHQRGWVTQETPLAVYPTPAEEAAALRVRRGENLLVTGSLRGEDGEEWYRTAEGDYVAASAVSFGPRPAPFLAPTVPVRTFPGRWLDVSLTEPARLTAYEDTRAVRTMLVIKGVGRWQTPTGVFSIVRRVANETMDSATIGIPRNAPGGYYLRNVLFTQYFTPQGHSLHYNWWSSMFGYAGSHGCLGLTHADSAFLWGWANAGTPVSIHY